MIPAYSLSLGQEILPGLATIGAYDGERPSLTCATVASKVFIHTPHRGAADEGDGTLRYLTVNQEITGLGAGRLGPARAGDTPGDVLVVGMPVNLMAYSPQANANVFYRDVPDGVARLVVGVVGDTRDFPVACVGGNCSLQGFDREGVETFWTVTGDKVTALALCDVDNDGRSELIVGSDDFEMRIFRGEAVLSTVTESAVPTVLTAVVGTRYGFGLRDGTIGVYNRATREWRVKSKHRVTALHSFDLDGDGVPELISGWDSGRVEVRTHDRNGTIVFADALPAPISALVSADYRLDGTLQAIVCARSGDVRGYVSSDAHGVGIVEGGGGGGAAAAAAADDPEARALARATAVAASASGLGGAREALDVTGGGAAVAAELASQRAELKQQLAKFEENVKRLKEKDGKGQDAGLVPSSTRVLCELQMDAAAGCVVLELSTTNRTVIRAVTVNAEALSESGEGVVAHPPAAIKVRVPLRPTRNAECNLQIKAVVGVTVGELYHTFELTKRLPRFAMFLLDTGGAGSRCRHAASRTHVRTTEPASRVLKWLQSAFLAKFDALAGAAAIEVHFVSMRGGSGECLGIAYEGGAEGATLSIATDDMDVAGDVVEDFAAFIGAKELDSMAEFDTEFKHLSETMTAVDEYNQVRHKLSAEIADRSALVKSLVVKAEDARMLGDWRAMSAAYQQVNDVNRDLQAEYAKRSANHTQLLASLKTLNRAVMAASRLRVGAGRQRTVAKCRAAIKANNQAALFQAMRTGGR